MAFPAELSKIQLSVGEYTLVKVNITSLKNWDPVNRVASGVNGTGLLHFDYHYLIPDPESYARKDFEGIKTRFEVVSIVTRPQTQIDLLSARLVKPDIELGENIDLVFELKNSELSQILVDGFGLTSKFNGNNQYIPVELTDIDIQVLDSVNKVGIIIRGEVVTKSIKISFTLNQFVIYVNSLKFSPKNCKANVTLELPSDIASLVDGKNAKVNLGTIEISPGFEFYKEFLNTPFGPWILKDTGLVISGNGFITDFSSQKSPSGKALNWKGVKLINGLANGENTCPSPSNTGYLKRARRDVIYEGRKTLGIKNYYYQWEYLYNSLVEYLAEHPELSPGPDYTSTPRRLTSQ